MIKNWISNPAVQNNYDEPIYTTIGQIAFYKVNSKNQSFDVEYCIGESYWGKGYATEALKAVIKYGFEKMNYKFMKEIKQL